MRTIVGVLRGGPSEYDVSLKSGASVLTHLDKERYDARDIFVDRAGVWHARGVPASPEKALAGIEVLFNALHGHYGANGRLQRLLDTLGVAYTGPSAYASALTFNRHLARQEAAQAGVQTPYGMLVEPADNLERVAAKILRSFPLPALIKPLYGSLASEVEKADDFYSLEQALARGFARSPKLLLEEYIPGRRATVGVINNFRGEDVYALIPAPNNFLAQEKETLLNVAKRVHAAVGPQYSTSDFVVGKRGIYFAEVEALPELHEGSKFHEALAGVGATPAHFFEHVIAQAKSRK